jgi:allantoinase
MKNKLDKEIDLTITGNLVMPGNEPFPATIGISKGKVAAIGAPGFLQKADRHFDYSDQFILPGGVDVHCHSLGYAGEGFINSTRGAAAGGITTVNDHPLDLGGAPTTTQEILNKAEKMGRSAYVDYALTAGVVSEKLQNIEPTAKGVGISAYKALMHCTAPRDWYGIWALEDWELLEAFEHVAATKLPILVHAENENMIVHYVKVLQQSNKVYPAAHSESRPEITEIEAVNRALCFADATGVRLHIVHVSLPDSFLLIDSYRKKGRKVSGETCPHFLVLTEDRWKEVGMVFKINPPLRSEQARKRLWEVLKAGKIDLISSDHSPRDAATSDIVFDNPSGTPGVETLMPLIFSEGVKKGQISIGRMVELVSKNPAILLGIYPKKGTLEIGSDADITVIDPDKKWVVEGSQLQTGCKLTAFEGIKVTGKVIATFVRGKNIYTEGEICGEPGYGKFTPRLNWQAN